MSDRKSIDARSACCVSHLSTAEQIDRVSDSGAVKRRAWMRTLIRSIPALEAAVAVLLVDRALPSGS